MRKKKLDQTELQLFGITIREETMVNFTNKSTLFVTHSSRELIFSPPELPKFSETTYTGKNCSIIFILFLQ
jgi:hypothetical protein